MNLRGSFAFTLIELLIVVAIIAILAAIAVPNFLEAQVRSKVSRVSADMRTCALAVEAYAVDNNAYPEDIYAPRYLGGTDWQTWRQLTTPVAYITAIARDPFCTRPTRFHDAPYPYEYGAQSNRPTPSQQLGYAVSGVYWVFCSVGPDGDTDYDWGTAGDVAAGYSLRNQITDWTYDPTNGSVSSGDVIRSSLGASR